MPPVLQRSRVRLAIDDVNGVRYTIVGGMVEVSEEVDRGLARAEMIRDGRYCW